MNIGIASSGLGHVSRGIEAWAEYLADALYSRGLPVTLFRAAGQHARPYDRIVPCWKRSDPATSRLLKILPRRFFWRLGIGTPYSIEQTTFALNLLSQLRECKIDLLHVKDPQLALLIQWANRLGIVATRVVLSHGTEETPAFLRKITYLHHLSPAHLDEARAAGAWKPQWRMISNFIDTDRFHPGCAGEIRAQLGIPADALIVLCAAAIKSSHKRIDYLLNEFASLVKAEPGLPVWLVIAGGRGPGTDALIQAGSKQLGDRVRFLVNYPLVEMPSLYRAADLFVLCSLKEMLGTVLLEATASAVPCLVHQHPSMEWVVGQGGLAIDMQQDGALAAAMGNLLRDQEHRREMGECARAHCVNTFGRDRIVGQYLDYYQFVQSHDPAADGSLAVAL